MLLRCRMTFISLFFNAGLLQESFQFFFIVIIVYFPSLVTVGISAPFFRLDLLSFPITNGLMEG